MTQTILVTDRTSPQEAKPYKNDREIIAMTNLVNAYQSSDIEKFQVSLYLDGLLAKKFFNFKKSTQNYSKQLQILEFSYCKPSLQNILKENNEAIMEDKFIREHIEALLRNIRTKVQSFLFYKNTELL